jgi:hypothetical protein
MGRGGGDPTITAEYAEYTEEQGRERKIIKGKIMGISKTVVA